MTSDVPKALLDIGGQTLLGRQIAAFAACGLRDFTIVTGFASGRMEAAVKEIAAATGVAARTVFNPFYAIADNLASC